MIAANGYSVNICEISDYEHGKKINVVYKESFYTLNYTIKYVLIPQGFAL